MADDPLSGREARAHTSLATQARSASRLYDVDVVLSKTLVYGGLIGLIMAAYVMIVVGLGSLVGAGGEPNLALSILATAVVASGFQPARARLQRLANRLVYGRRATPYEVMADFARRVSAAVSTDEVLPRVAEAAARGVGAERSRVRVLLPGGRERSVDWPDGSTGNRFDRTVQVVHRGESVGEIAVAKPVGDRLAPAETELLDDLASQAGLALRNVVLMGELEDRLREISAQAAELAASRQRLVAAQDAERRLLERDLHDGTQQRLVSLSGQLRLLNRIVRQDPNRAEQLLDELIQEADEALEDVRDLGRGIFPQILADKGLVAALSARLAKHFPHASLECDGEVASARFDPGVEAAVYFCCLEAVQNVGRHAGGAPAEVHVWKERDTLVFRVTDRGRGFDQTAVSSGTGLQNIADRLAALGGELDVQSKVGYGTTVTARIPLEQSDPVDA